MGKLNQYNPQTLPHPGIILKEKLDEMVIGPKEFSIRTSKPEQTITAILKGESSITPDMAVSFESVTKIPANYWLNHQQGYNEFLAREKLKEVIDTEFE